MFDRFMAEILSYAECMRAFLNSDFATASIAAVIGTFVGAYGAHRLAERDKGRAELIAEVRNTNAAVMIASGIFNTAFAIKHQHVDMLKTRYDESRAAFIAFIEATKVGAPPSAGFSYVADFATLSLPPLPLDNLRTQIYERITAVEPLIRLQLLLDGSASTLRSSLEQRNMLISEFKTMDEGAVRSSYFGVQNGQKLDMIYSHLIDAIYTHTDDCMFFARKLVEQLTKHGDNLATRFEKEFGKGCPSPAKADFSRADKSGMMPSSTLYQDLHLGN